MGCGMVAPNLEKAEQEVKELLSPPIISAPCGTALFQILHRSLSADH